MKICNEPTVTKKLTITDVPNGGVFKGSGTKLGTYIRIASGTFIRSDAAESIYAVDLTTGAMICAPIDVEKVYPNACVKLNETDSSC